MEATQEIKPGESLMGTAASVGIVKGRVRVVTADSINELRPGEVLVAESLDVGWTPFFSYAAAVVVDTGAVMSHAAIVAREFGIPCVVRVKDRQPCPAHWTLGRGRRHVGPCHMCRMTPPRKERGAGDPQR